MASVASVYARAFADVVSETGLDAGKIMGELRQLSALLRSNPDLRRVWESPAIPAEGKRGVLDRVVARERFSKSVPNFVAVLIDHRRTHFFDATATRLGHELNARMGFAEAQITTSGDRSASERRGLESQSTERPGKNVRAEYLRDPTTLCV